MPTERLTKTVILPLETSQRKNERVRAVIDEWQTIASRMTDLMPSVGPEHWRSQDSTLFHLVNDEFPNTSLRSHDAHQAAYKVGEAWGSWHSNAHDQRRPTFGDGDYARFCHCGIEIETNDRGYGVKVNLEPYKPEWWHITGGKYQREYLKQIVAGDLSTGSGELHLNGDQLKLHLAMSEEIDVREWVDVETVVGAHLGELVLCSAVAVVDEEIVDVDMHPGREFRHHRELLKQKRARLSENGDLRAIKQARNQYYNYTDHVTHQVAYEVVDMARQHPGPGIVLEDLTHYRETAEDPIHDWPYDKLKTNITYKATAEGIPIRVVSPASTSMSCRQCGHEDSDSKSRLMFECTNCGYEVHADVNAGANIATKA